LNGGVKIDAEKLSFEIIILPWFFSWYEIYTFL